MEIVKLLKIDAELADMFDKYVCTAWKKTQDVIFAFKRMKRYVPAY